MQTGMVAQLLRQVCLHVFQAQQGCSVTTTATDVTLVPHTPTPLVNALDAALHGNHKFI
jgi:hypothetical protein